MNIHAKKQEEAESEVEPPSGPPQIIADALLLAIITSIIVMLVSRNHTIEIFAVAAGFSAITMLFAMFVYPFIGKW